MAGPCPRCHALVRQGKGFCPQCGTALATPATGALTQSWIIGAGAGADLLVPSATVSTRHCRLVLENGQYWVEDLNSLNGTFLEEQRITQPRAVAFKSPVTLGQHVPMPWPAPQVLPPLPPAPSSVPGPKPAQPGWGTPARQPEHWSHAAPVRGGGIRSALITVGLLLLIGGGGLAMAGYQEKNSVTASIERVAGALPDMFQKKSPLGTQTNQAADQKLQLGGVLAAVGAALLLGAC
jgi:hypothetical protein